MQHGQALTVHEMKIQTSLSGRLCPDMSKLRLSPASAEYVRFERLQLESAPCRNPKTTCEKPNKALQGLSVDTSAPMSHSFPRPDGQDGTCRAISATKMSQEFEWNGNLVNNNEQLNEIHSPLIAYCKSDQGSGGFLKSTIF